MAKDKFILEVKPDDPPPFVAGKPEPKKPEPKKDDPFKKAASDKKK